MRALHLARIKEAAEIANPDANAPGAKPYDCKFSPLIATSQRVSGHTS